MSTATLYTRAQKWKQLKCPLTDEWIKTKQNKTVYIYTMKCQPLKKNEILPFVMDLGGIMLRETVRERKIPYDFTYVWNLKKAK